MTGLPPAPDDDAPLPAASLLFPLVPNKRANSSRQNCCVAALSATPLAHTLACKSAIDRALRAKATMNSLMFLSLNPMSVCNWSCTHRVNSLSAIGPAAVPFGTSAASGQVES